MTFSYACLLKDQVQWLSLKVAKEEGMSSIYLSISQWLSDKRNMLLQGRKNMHFTAQRPDHRRCMCRFEHKSSASRGQDRHLECRSLRGIFDGMQWPDTQSNFTRKRE